MWFENTENLCCIHLCTYQPSIVHVMPPVFTAGFYCLLQWQVILYNRIFIVSNQIDHCRLLLGVRKLLWSFCVLLNERIRKIPIRILIIRQFFSHDGNEGVLIKNERLWIFDGCIEGSDQNVKEYQQQLDEMVPGYSQELMALYPFFEHQKIGETFSSIFTHTMEACPSLRIADIWSVKKPVYFYEFNEQPTAPLLWLMTLTYNKGAADLGVHHGADIPYVFGHSSIAGSIVYKRQKKTRKLTMQYWTNFARSGNPNGNNLPTWPIYNSSSPQNKNESKNMALSLKSEPELRTAYLEKYCNFWNEHQEFSFW